MMYGNDKYGVVCGRGQMVNSEWVVLCLGE